MLTGDESLLYEQRATSGLDLSCPHLEDAWEALKDGEPLHGWLLCSYSGPNSIVLENSGSGGFKSLVPHLMDTKVQFGAFRISCSVGAKTVAKLVSLAWVGSEVSGGMARARVAMHRGAVDAYFAGTVAQLSFDGADETTSLEKTALDDADREHGGSTVLLTPSRIAIVRRQVGAAAMLTNVRLGPDDVDPCDDQSAEGGGEEGSEDEEDVDVLSSSSSGDFSSCSALLPVDVGNAISIIDKPVLLGVQDIQGPEKSTVVGVGEGKRDGGTLAAFAAKVSASKAAEAVKALWSALPHAERSDYEALPTRTLLELRALADAQAEAFTTTAPPQEHTSSCHPSDLWMRLTPPSLASLAACPDEPCFPDVVRALGYRSPSSSLFYGGGGDSSQGMALCRRLLAVDPSHPSGFGVVAAPPLPLLLLLRVQLEASRAQCEAPANKRSACPANWSSSFQSRGGVTLLLRLLDALADPQRLLSNDAGGSFLDCFSTDMNIDVVDASSSDVVVGQSSSQRKKRSVKITGEESRTCDALLISRCVVVACLNALTVATVQRRQEQDRDSLSETLSSPPVNQKSSSETEFSSVNTPPPPPPPAAAAQPPRPDIGTMLAARGAPPAAAAQPPRPDIGAMLAARGAPPAAAQPPRPDIGAMLAARGAPPGAAQPPRPDIGAMLAARRAPPGATQPPRPDIGAMLAARGAPPPPAQPPRREVGKVAPPQSPASALGHALESSVDAGTSSAVSMREDEVYSIYMRMIHVLGVTVDAAKHKLAKEHPNLDPSPLDLSPDAPAPIPRPQRSTPTESKEKKLTGGEKKSSRKDDSTEGDDEQGESPQLTRRLFWEPINDVSKPSSHSPSSSSISSAASMPRRGGVFASLPATTALAAATALVPGGGGGGTGGGRAQPSSMSSLLAAGISSTFTIVEVKRSLTYQERVGRAVGAIGGVLKEGSLTFIADKTRFNNIAIKLKQLRLSDDEILKRVVRCGPPSWLTLERLELLLAVAPNGEDLESIAPFDGDPALLATCEHFFYTVQHVPVFTRRLEALRGRLLFPFHADEAMRQIEVIAAATAQLATSLEFRKFLGLVLATGNMLNRGTSRGGAKGFDLNILPKLSLLRSTNDDGSGRTNLLRFLAEFIDKNGTTAQKHLHQIEAPPLPPFPTSSSSPPPSPPPPSSATSLKEDEGADGDEDLEVPIKRWFDELTHISAATQASFDRATKALVACEKIVTHAQRTIVPVTRKPVYLGSQHGDRFLLVMKPFIAHAENVMSELKHRLDETKAAYFATAAFFGASVDTSADEDRQTIEQATVASSAKASTSAKSKAKSDNKPTSSNTALSLPQPAYLFSLLSSFLKSYQDARHTNASKIAAAAMARARQQGREASKQRRDARRRRLLEAQEGAAETVSTGGGSGQGSARKAGSAKQHRKASSVASVEDSSGHGGGRGEMEKMVEARQSRWRKQHENVDPDRSTDSAATISVEPVVAEDAGEENSGHNLVVARNATRDEVDLSGSKNAEEHVASNAAAASLSRLSQFILANDGGLCQHGPPPLSATLATKQPPPSNWRQQPSGFTIVGSEASERDLGVGGGGGETTARADEGLQPRKQHQKKKRSRRGRAAKQGMGSGGGGMGGAEGQSLTDVPESSSGQWVVSGPLRVPISALEVWNRMLSDAADTAAASAGHSDAVARSAISWVLFSTAPTQVRDDLLPGEEMHASKSARGGGGGGATGKSSSKTSSSGLFDLSVLGCGRGGLGSLRDAMASQETACGGFTLIAHDAAGSNRVKCVAVVLARPTAAARQKAQATQLFKGRLLNNLLPSQCHLVLEVDDPSGVDESAVAQRLVQCGGAHAATSFDFLNIAETGDSVDDNDLGGEESAEETDNSDEEGEDQSDSNTIIPSEAQVSGGGKATDVSPSQRGSDCDDVAFLGGELVVSGRCVSAWGRLRSFHEPTSWALFAYSSSSGAASWGGSSNASSLSRHLEVVGEGSGGLRDLIGCLTASQLLSSVCFGCLAVRASDGSGSQRLKLVVALLSPPSASSRDRATAANHKGVLLGGVFLGTHLVLEMDDLRELTAEAIVTRLIAAGGAHSASSFTL